MPSHNAHGAPVYDFGWWPEIVGAAYAGGLIWFLVAFAEGFI